MIKSLMKNETYKHLIQSKQNGLAEKVQSIRSDTHPVAYLVCYPGESEIIQAGHLTLPACALASEVKQHLLGGALKTPLGVIHSGAVETFEVNIDSGDTKAHKILIKNNVFPPYDKPVYMMNTKDCEILFFTYNAFKQI